MFLTSFFISWQTNKQKNSCEATKQATEQLVCLGWMKLVQYDPIKLLQHINVVEHDSACEKVVSILFHATHNDSLAELSDSERRAYYESLQNATISLSVRNDDHASPSSQQLFLSIAATKHAVTQREKDDIMSQLVPDVSVLCQVLDQETGKLIQAIQDQDAPAEDELVSIGVQLLQLAALTDHEEGSRRLLATALQRLLQSILTPDDLIEDAVKTMRSVCRDDADFVEQIAAITNKLDQNLVQEVLSINHQLRVLSILTVLLELIDPKQAGNPALADFSDSILPSVTHDNILVREAAVNCVGKLGLFVSADRIQHDFEPLLLQILQDEQEKLAIRAQAMLGLADWSLLHQVHPSFADFVSTALTRTPYPQGLVCLAAEVATKLLLVGKSQSQHWLAALLVLLFDPNDNDDDEEEEDNVGQVGSPLRTHQILTLFFPAYCLKPDFGANLVKSVSALLQLVQQRSPKKKKLRWPVAKMLDYVVVTTSANSSSEADGDDDNNNNNKSSDNNQESVEADSKTTVQSYNDHVLDVALQVATFLEQNLADLSSTLRRSLCKWLGGSVIADDATTTTRQGKVLSQLKRAVDALEDMLDDDATCFRAMAPLVKLLENVPVGEEDDETESGDDDDDDDPESSQLADATEQLNLEESSITTGKENQSHVDDRNSKASDRADSRRSSLESHPINS